MTRRRPFDPLTLQGAYYALGGVWPIVHLRSFMAVTGRKHDTWLVKSFGAFISAVGAALLTPRDAGERRLAERAGVASGLSLAAAEAWYVARGRISPVYLADAVIQLLLAGAILRRRN